MSSTEPPLERLKAETDDKRFGGVVEVFGVVIGFIKGVTGADAVRVSYRGIVGCCRKGLAPFGTIEGELNAYEAEEDNGV